MKIVSRAIYYGHQTYRTPNSTAAVYRVAHSRETAINKGPIKRRTGESVNTPEPARDSNSNLPNAMDHGPLSKRQRLDHASDTAVDINQVSGIVYIYM